MKIVLAVVFFVVYGWAMHRQGKKLGFTIGAISAGTVIVAQMIREERMTRNEAKRMIPVLTDELLNEILKQVNDASVQPKEH